MKKSTCAIETKCCAGIFVKLSVKFSFFLLLVMILALPASAEVIRIATWNIENLRADSGEGKNPRYEQDYRRLGKYAKLLDADIVALQEIENEAVLRRVFDPKLYKFFVSTRKARSRKHTAFAIKEEVPVKRHRDLYSDRGKNGILRHGVDIGVTVNGKSIRFLSVHLKALCSEHILMREGAVCKELASQVSILEEWIDGRVDEGVPFVVMGDFNHRLRGKKDNFWLEIDDGEPTGADLVRATEGFDTECLSGRRSSYVDHIIYGLEVKKWVVAGSFGELVYSEPRSMTKLLSDHCPIFIRLDVSRGN